MASRFPRQRDPRSSSSLFDSYGGGDSRPASRSPAPAGGYGYGGYAGPAANAYPNGNGSASFRSATPDKKGHYSDAVLSSLESQNDAEVEGITAKVKMLKDMTIAIGDEIRDTSYLNTLENSFESTRVKLRGNMNRMLRMAERTGVGWKVWLGFFAAVFFLFFYVWVF
ncbi:putative SNARE complex subunit (Bet1) [Penicillium brasilianum]|uniref:Putative SNARE complex subunit (Bet1) n=1 Tax=Penicillium brasilianum TaxID=104259 RepID=A0A1S9RFM7_PENBI|nr:putative SNARE complex subunit (Bet1) [Penicillium brasilianum]